MLRLLATMAFLLATGPGALAADLPYPSKIRYVIYRGGHQVGQHVVTFEHKGPIKVVTADCEVEVRTMGVAAYRYTYRSREEWNGEVLQSLHAKTDDNGQLFTVTAERRGSALVVERTNPAPAPTAALADQGYRGPDVIRQSVAGNLLPTSGWDIRQVRQNSLLNTQTGTVARVDVTPAGRERVQTGAGGVEATHYRYTGDLRMDQWFDDKGRWVKGTFTAFDGSTIEYILQE
jgi:hypothetical protein